MNLVCRVMDSSRAVLGATLLLAAFTGCAMWANRDVETVSTVGGMGSNKALAGPIVSDPRSLGREDAPIVIVEYSDYQCPYCGQFHATVLPRLKSEYIDSGKVRFIFRDLPLAMHRESVPAAIAALCATEQGKFWEMNAALFANNRTLGTALYGQLAQALKLDVEKFDTCVQNPLSRRRVQMGAQEAKRYGLSATPSFILGRFDKGKVAIHRTASGFTDFETFSREIDSLLAISPALDNGSLPVHE